MSIVLAAPAIVFAPGTTTRRQVERELGIAFSYPARGWHTYAVDEAGTDCLLSAFYSDGTLIAVELYLPRSQRAPALEPRNLGGFALRPGHIRIGMPVDDVGAPFVEKTVAVGAIVYDRHFEAAFEGGVAHAMARGGRIERLTVYAAPRANA